MYRERASAPITKTLLYIPVRMYCAAVTMPTTKPLHAAVRSNATAFEAPIELCTCEQAQLHLVIQTLSALAFGLKSRFSPGRRFQTSHPGWMSLAKSNPSPLLEGLPSLELSVQQSQHGCSGCLPVAVRAFSCRMRILQMKMPLERNAVYRLCKGFRPMFFARSSEVCTCAS